MTQQTTIAVLGLGTMGRAMAGRILAAGLPTTVWNRTPEAAEGLAAHGARVAKDPAEAVHDADVVVTMVTDIDAVLWIAQDAGMLDALPAGAIWAQTSTIGVAGIDRVARLVTDRRPDVILVDAPVAGSKGPAEQGKLTIFAAGPDEARQRVAPLFDAIGERTVWVGPVGHGTRVKLVNNTLLAFDAQALAESLAVGASFGLDTTTVLEAMAGSPLVSAWTAQKMRRVAEDRYDAEYALSLGLKDIGLALAGSPVDALSAANSILGQWRRAVDRGAGDEDVTVIVRELRSR